MNGKDFKHASASAGITKSCPAMFAHGSLGALGIGTTDATETSPRLSTTESDEKDTGSISQTAETETDLPEETCIDTTNVINPIYTFA